MTGRLDEVELPELVQLFASGRRSVRIEVTTADNRRGRIYVEHGQITECRFGDLLGEDAFFGLFESGGRFMVYRFDPERSRQAMVSRGWQELILEAARRKDEAERDRAELDPADAYVEELDNVLRLPLGGGNDDVVNRADEARLESPPNARQEEPTTERSTSAESEAPPASDPFDEAFAAAMRAYLRRDLERAETLFLRCDELRPGDPRVAANLKRLESMRSHR